MFDRRALLKALAALGVAAATPARAQRLAKPRFTANPFRLGVASGYPRPDGVVLWTRLALAPEHAHGGIDPEAIAVRWEVAHDEKFSSIAASGTEESAPEWAHSLHVEPKGLEPDRWYWYRFIAGDAVSPVGRTRTAPVPDSAVERLRFAFASCQQYEQGWYGAYRHIVADAPDLIAFLGDYIYESSWGDRLKHVRKHDRAFEPQTLDEYRVRHALYKGDPDLQSAHASCPWIVTWDDHEVDNDYADDLPEYGMSKEMFLARRAAAYRAYYEHMPLPAHMRPAGPYMRIYSQLAWGTLARFYALDGRQYRSYHACRRLWRRGEGKTVDVEECPALFNPARSMLGRAQERWLESALADSRARWNLLAQQTRIAQFDEKPGPGRRAWTDSWDGYPAARSRLLDFLADRRIANPVAIGGDVHSFNVADLKRDFEDAASPVVASEIVGTSITSEGRPQEWFDAFLPDNPHMKLLDSRYRGYVRVELTPKRLVADLRAMETVQKRDAPCSTLGTYVVEDGKPGPVRA